MSCSAKERVVLADQPSGREGPSYSMLQDRSGEGVWRCCLVLVMVLVLLRLHHLY